VVRIHHPQPKIKDQYSNKKNNQRVVGSNPTTDQVICVAQMVEQMAAKMILIYKYLC